MVDDINEEIFKSIFFIKTHSFHKNVHIIIIIETQQWRSSFDLLTACSMDK